MFTGLITDVGHIKRTEGEGDVRLVIKTGYDTATIEIGASIACNGICLTVVDKDQDSFTAEATKETVRVTTLGSWRKNSLINLERSLKLGDEMGGHIVSGHVDCVGEVEKIEPDGSSNVYTFSCPESFAHLVVQKGSICINGVSLTVNTVEDRPNGHVHFKVTIIPHTHDHTSFRSIKTGDFVNLEFDLLARYVARLQEKS